MKSLLIVGANGMAGHMAGLYLKSLGRYKVMTLAREQRAVAIDYLADVTDFDKLKSVISDARPDFVLNCVGVLNQVAENNPDVAVLLNSYLPHFLARQGKEAGFKLIHISTDCVFCGSRGAYTEGDFKDGKGFYAQSKALGEVIDKTSLTLRTSIIGPEIKDGGIGLFDWFMKQSGTVKGYSNAYWTGVTTLHLAKAVDYAMTSNVSGLCHLVNSRKISKLELLTIFKSVFNRSDVAIEKYDGYQVDKSLINTRTDFAFPVPDYPQMIEEMKAFMLEHARLYGKYLR